MPNQLMCIPKLWHLNGLLFTELLEGDHHPFFYVIKKVKSDEQNVCIEKLIHFYHLCHECAVLWFLLSPTRGGCVLSNKVTFGRILL